MDIFGELAVPKLFSYEIIKYNLFCIGFNRGNRFRRKTQKRRAAVQVKPCRP